MKSFSLLAVAAFALLVPTLANASEPVRLVYRPELRMMVPVKPAHRGTPITHSRHDEIARHQAMARAYRGSNHKGMFDAALHCDRLVAQLRKAGDAAD